MPSPEYSPVHPSEYEDDEEDDKNPYSTLSDEDFERQMILLEQFEREKKRRGYSTRNPPSQSSVGSTTHHISVPVLDMSDLLSKEVNFFKATETNVFCEKIRTYELNSRSTFDFRTLKDQHKCN